MLKVFSRLLLVLAMAAPLAFAAGCVNINTKKPVVDVKVDRTPEQPPAQYVEPYSQYQEAYPE